jgi:Plasmid pRiA4b ORF-3-like protein
MQLHAMLQILFPWSDEHMYSFYVHGREYGSNSAHPAPIRISDLHLHPGQRFRYVHDFIAPWKCDIA